MKLTLSLDKELIEFAHKLAKESNDSISNMVSTVLKNAIKRNQESGGETMPPALASLYGRYRKKPIPDKDEMKKRLLRKHLG